MKSLQKKLLAMAVVCAAPASTHAAESIIEALQTAKVSGDFNLRYESVDNNSVDSDGLTLRSRLGFASGNYQGFSAFVEVEDVRDMFGIDDEDNLIPDPEVTEIDQAFIQYKQGDYSTKVGRQVIALDGHRFVGHVGWRQDRQTFDAVRTQFVPIAGMNVDLSYIYQRNRIFAEDLDAKSADVLLNVAYQTAVGKLVGYGYLLDDDSRDEQSDTYGLSLNGQVGTDTAFTYHLEYATQEIDDAGMDYDTDYHLLELGMMVAGITGKLGYEVLGSDDGQASFTTPLATLHKFNGWNDIFLGGSFDPAAMPNGLVDNYLSVGGTLAGVAITLVHHQFEAEEGSADYGEETGLQLQKKFSHGLSAGVKYASYNADSFAVDTDKLWVWLGATF